VIAVVTAGSAVDISSIEPYADAIILAWYPGEQGGAALADIIFGKVSPSGRLPITFYKSLEDLPPYDSYAVKGRTYRYFDGAVQYPFGYGLSYVNFSYRWVEQPQPPRSLDDTLRFSVAVKNDGSMNADEVTQVYLQYPSLDRMPIKELKSFRRVYVQKGKESVVYFSIPVAELQKWDSRQAGWKLYPGEYKIGVGASSQDLKLNFPINIRAGLN
jgi:beta-glucosidase